MIKLEDITGKQLKQIIAHPVKGKKMGIDFSYSDAWDIEVDDEIVKGWTSMDNFDMREFLERIGVDMKKVSWDD
jgi:hypothetical protein